MRHLLSIIVIIILAAITGCATITKGSNQAMVVSTTGCEAESEGAINCVVKNKDNNITVNAPGTISIDKGSNDLTVNCKSDNGKATGNAVVSSTYEAMNAGNILLGGFIGVGVDAITGAMWKFPAGVVVPMKCKPSPD